MVLKYSILLSFGAFNEGWLVDWRTGLRGGHRYGGFLFCMNWRGGSDIYGVWVWTDRLL